MQENLQTGCKAIEDRQQKQASRQQNPIGNRIGNPIGNPIGKPTGHPIMLSAPFGLQLGRVRIQDLPKRQPKALQKPPRDPPPHKIQRKHTSNWSPQGPKMDAQRQPKIIQKLLKTTFVVMFFPRVFRHPLLSFVLVCQGPHHLLKRCACNIFKVFCKIRQYLISGCLWSSILSTRGDQFEVCVALNFVGGSRGGFCSAFGCLLGTFWEGLGS